MPQDDLKIIESCLLGNTQAFSQLIDKYKSMVYNLAYRMCSNYHDSEDITQEAFVKSFQSLSHYNPAFRFSTWLYQITMNIIKDRLKKKNIETISFDNFFSDKRIMDEGIVSGQENNPENQLDRQEDKEKIQQAIMSLPIKYREIIVLRHFQDLSYREMASILRVSMGTVKVRLYRARENLQNNLQKN